MGLVRVHPVARRPIIVVGVVLIAHKVIVLVELIVVLRVVLIARVFLVARVAVVSRVVLAAAVVQQELVDESTGVTWRIDFIPQRYISCGQCARRTPPLGSARRDCPPFRSWCSPGRGRCVNWPKLNR